MRDTIMSRNVSRLKLGLSHLDANCHASATLFCPKETKGHQETKGHPLCFEKKAREDKRSGWTKLKLANRNDGVYAVTMVQLVIDTNVFVAGLRSAGGASREVLRRALVGSYQPLFGNALWQEYCDLLGRDVWGVTTTSQERQKVLAALAQRGRWVTIYYGWRPNLPDEADNHLIELALAGGAAGIVTHNVRDLGRGELVFDQLRVVTPAQCLEEWQ